MLQFKAPLISSIVFLLCLSLSVAKITSSFCTLCPNQDHTMCKYGGIGAKCENVGPGGVSESEKKEIVDIHNWYRKIVASGHERRGSGGPQPKAANMMQLHWDDDLATVAQRWADQCLLQHDTCRDDPRWKVGQNIYWKWKTPVHVVNWTEAITSWYNEVSLFNPSIIKSYSFDSGTGHYTQMLWHDTAFIGCGRRDYGKNKIYVCNYGPTGNWITEPIYAVGEPCSKCPSNTVCNEYLCDSQRSGTSPKNNATAPVDSSSTKKGGPEVQRPKQQPAAEPKPNTSQVNIEDNIILDKETLDSLEDIKTKIKNLLKKVFRKGRQNH